MISGYQHNIFIRRIQILLSSQHPHETKNSSPGWVHIIYSTSSRYFSNNYVSVVIVKDQNQSRIYCTSKISTKNNSTNLLPQISRINNDFIMRFHVSTRYTDENAVINCFVACPTPPLTACVTRTTQNKTPYQILNPKTSIHEL